MPAVPENTSEELVASGINVNTEALSSYPKKPTLAALPLCHLNSIPRSLLSSDPGAESPPMVKIGSSTVVTVLFTVVVVPFTVRLPPIVTAPVVVKVSTYASLNLTPEEPRSTSLSVFGPNIQSATYTCSAFAA